MGPVVFVLVAYTWVVRGTCIPFPPASSDIDHEFRFHRSNGPVLDALNWLEGETAEMVRTAIASFLGDQLSSDVFFGGVNIQL